MPQPSSRRPGISRLDLMIFGLVLLILGIGLGVSWQVHRLILQADAAQQRERVNTLARTVRDAFEIELGHATSAVDAAAHFASFQPQLTAEVWHSFASSTLQRFPQIRQLAWAPLVKGNERERFVEQVQRAGLADYRISMQNAAGETLPATPADQYMPLLFAEPAAPERMGRDQMRNPSWWTGFRASRDAAEPAFSTADPADCASASVPVAGAAAPGACVDLVAASYLNGRPDTMFGRRLNYRGAVTAVLSYPMLMQEAVRRARAAQLDLWLFDRDSNVRLVFADVDAAAPTAKAAIDDFEPQETDAVLSVISSSRAWEIVLRPQPVAADPGLSPAALAGLIGVVCTLLIAGLLLALGYGIRETARARAAAEAAAQAKTTFLANMSHEIRTPMNAVIGLAHLALRTDLSPKQRDYIEKVHTAGQSLLGIINDVLDFSKIEAGHLAMEHTAFELDQVLSQAATVTAHKAADGGLELLFDVAEDVPGQLIGDPLRLGQVLINLINNAIKFTEHGQIVVRCALAETSANESGAGPDAKPKLLLLFSVQDSGIGMTPEQCTRLFTAFSQADESTTRKYGGTGLGLSISKRLVELTGGQISVASEWGVGSTFQFTWGCEVDPLARVEPRPAPELLAGLRVLVVDDNAVARTILSHALSHLGCAAEAVPDADTALRRLAEEDADRPFQLLLTDWSMPGMDGLALARAVRTSTALRHVPKILLATAFGREDAFESVDGVYLDGVVIKPVARPVLLDALLAVMHGGDKRVATPGQRQTEAVPHLQGVRVLLAEDNEINQQIAVELITSTMAQVDVADNGSIALDLLHAHGPAHYQVVLLDMQMPVLDGYETARRIRSDRRYAGLPIVAMTAHALVEERERCLAAGMDDHVAKPIDPALLYETLVRWTGGARPREGLGVDSATHQPASAAEPAVPPALPTIPTELVSLAAQVPQLDVAGAMRRVAQNSALYLDLLKRFNASQADFPERVRNSLAHGDTHNAELLAHTLKGVAANIGANTLAAQAGALEAALRDGAEPAQAGGDPVNATQTALQDLLTPLQAWLAAGDPAASAVPVDQPHPQAPSDQSRAAFAALRQRLQDMDSSAADELTALLPQLRQTMPPERLRQVEQLVAAFDFDEALSLLPETID